ncbi:hypothetical protein JCM10207_007710 [Rhodosporidiobolus poonsookiae]
MAAVYSKGLPQAAHQLAHGSSHSLHRDFHLPASSSSSAAAFRSDASSSSRISQDDFGAFATPSYTPATTFSRSRDSPTWSTRQSHLADGGGGSLIDHPTRNATHDGAEVAALFGDSYPVFADAIDGNWEQELLDRQRERHDLESALPADPFASRAARSARETTPTDGVKGKGRAPEAHRKGDMSPTTEELVSSLSSLDLSSRAYLRTLLSLPPEAAIEDYLAHGSYTDDVHGLPDDVKRLFEKAAAGTAGVSVEEGRAKAVRRLGMVMQHLRAAEAGGEQAAVAPASFQAEQQPAWQYQGQYEQDGPMLRRLQPMNQNAAVFSSPAFAQSFQSSLSSAQQQRDLALSSQAPAVAQSQPLTFASSLSESAFITVPASAPYEPLSTSHVTPQPARLVSSPPTQAAQQHIAPEDTLPDSYAPLPSFESYFASQQQRMASNNGGRSGPDFTRAIPAAVRPALFAPQSGRRQEVVTPMQVDLAQLSEGQRVTEGRTH